MINPDASQRPDAVSQSAQVLRWLVLVIGIGMAALYIYTATQRLVFPHEIKWMEGGVLDQVLQILDGKSLYAEPSWSFGTYLYTPFYYYLSAAVSFITGPTFMSIRLVSFLSSLAVAALLAGIVRRESGSVFAGIVAGLFFLAATKATGFFMDAGRIDTLFLALVLGYVYCARYVQNLSGQLLAATLGALALLTKQTAVVACLPIALYLLFIQTGRLRLVVPVVGTALALTGLAYFYVSSDGWFTYYVFELPREHRYQWGKLPSLTLTAFLLQYPFIVCASIGAIALAARDQLRGIAFSLLLFITLTFSALLPYMHTGSAPNVLLPLQGACALLLGTALGLLEHRGRLYVAALLVTVPQFLMLAYAPATVLLDDAHIARAEKMVRCMAALPKPPLNTRTGYLWTLADTPRSIHEPSVADIFRAADGPENQAMHEAFVRLIEQQHYSALFFGAQMTKELAPLLSDYYVDAGFNLSNATGDARLNSYLLSKTYVSREFMQGRELSGTPLCEAGAFFK